ncbi:MAG: hypothetical protein N3A66_08425, partial [Planctomycetota bacterium]|nr:hypothetical protein [Planctomycetota bacterium]
GKLPEADYRRLQRFFLALAYMFADPDYCRYGDFWPQREPEEKVAEALKDDMGDCPVPPNFASEFFTTVGVMALLYPSHPAAPLWQTWAEEQTGVQGTFQHFLEISMPPLRTNTPRLESAFGPLHYGHMVEVRAGWRLPRRAVMPANGNSGGHGLEQDYGGELSVGACVYKNSDPVLARNLMALWQAAGKLIIDPVHPLLTFLTLDPVYSPDREMSSGYTGLERAPEPLLVHIGDDFDWCALRIVNTNSRPGSLFYTQQIPCPRTEHIRSYLFVKPDYFLVWDVFPLSHGPTLFFLHPTAAMIEIAPGRFRAGSGGEPHLLVQFLQPQQPQVVANRRLLRAANNCRGWSAAKPSFAMAP